MAEPSARFDDRAWNPEDMLADGDDEEAPPPLVDQPTEDIQTFRTDPNDSFGANRLWEDDHFKLQIENHNPEFWAWLGSALGQVPGVGQSSNMAVYPIMQFVDYTDCYAVYQEQLCCQQLQADNSFHDFPEDETIFAEAVAASKQQVAQRATHAGVAQQMGDALVKFPGLDQPHKFTTAVLPEQYTTVMLKNLPLNYTSQKVVDLLNAHGFHTKYDFLYVPLEYKAKRRLGYAMVNLVDNAQALRFGDHFDGFDNWGEDAVWDDSKTPIVKSAEVKWNFNQQGTEELIARYRNSPLMHKSVEAEFRPLLFNNKGTLVPFPKSKGRIKAPRP